MAGSWSQLSYRTGSLHNRTQSLVGLVKSFIADHSDGSVPADEEIPYVTGLLAGVDVVFGTPAPDAVVITLKTIDGITLHTSASLTASGRVEIIPAIPVCGGLKISVTTNTTIDAEGDVIPLMFGDA